MNENLKKQFRKQCDMCNLFYSAKRIVYFKGQSICRYCMINYKTPESHKTVSFYTAINRIYQVRPDSSRKYANGRCSFPPILIGRKFKITLVKEK